VRILRARYRNGSEFLDAYQASFLHGGIFFPTREQVALGEAVVLEIAFPELMERLLLRGFVSFRRAGRHRTKQRAGIGIELLASESPKRDFLLAVARGEMARPVAPRRHRRLPVSLPIEMQIKEQAGTVAATLDDIGPGGAFIRTHELTPEGTPVVLSLVPPGGVSPLHIEGRVAWSRRAPGDEGLGVEFRCRDTGGLRRLKELVRRLEASA
jgi:uncharacterized protein (TIGR02266 family)